MGVPHLAIGIPPARCRRKVEDHMGPGGAPFGTCWEVAANPGVSHGLSQQNPRYRLAKSL